MPLPPPALGVPDVPPPMVLLPPIEPELVVPPTVPDGPGALEPVALDVPLVPGVVVPAVPAPPLCAMAIVDAAASATTISAFLLSMR
jgi:hypothetical protein